MRRIAMIISALLATSSTLATAQPYDRDRRTDEGWRERSPYQAGWEVLGSSALNSPVNRMFVGAQAGRFNRLRVQSTNGWPQLGRIYVRFMDNSVQTIEVHRRLRPNEFLDLELNGRGRRISSITVVGRPDPRASYTISAML